jgi:solute carrier family 25 S-adenosylmethionine transporter 26
MPNDRPARRLRQLCAAAALLACASAAVAKKSSSWKDRMLFRERLIAGAGARGVAQTVLHPIDVARTRLQAKGVQMQFTPRTFVKGVAPQFILAFPAGAMQFASYEFCKAKAAAVGIKGGLAEVICGASGALAASLIRVPQEVLKQRVQADIYPNAAVGLSRVLSEKGIAGLYTGYLATISRDVPWNALSFMFFSQAKAFFAATTGAPPTTEQNLGLGALSGMMAAIIMTPVDVVKTRLMTGSATGGIVGTMSRIVTEEGAATLMKGVVPRIVFLAPLAAMTLSLYEAFGMALVSRRLQVPASEL